ncbi:unnamed protein product, partial [Didymodactylos carnosus]
WDTTTEELRQLYTKCIDKRILVGAINGSSSTVLALAAVGPSTILQLETSLNQPIYYNNVYWYLTSNTSFGFSPLPKIIQSKVDIETVDGDKRLSWYLDRATGGWRAGTTTGLHHDNNWRKIIMTEK